MTESTGANMKDEEAKTAFVAGYEMDVDIANNIFLVVKNSVPRVVEELVIAGKRDDEVKAAAITTAEAVVEAFVFVCKATAKVGAPASPRSSTPNPQGVDQQQPEAQ
ncbi:TPA: hypothetical protein ACXIJH_004930 [Serratia marcescens]